MWGLETKEKLGPQRRNMFRKGKSAVKGDSKISWSGIETSKHRKNEMIHISIAIKKR